MHVRKVRSTLKSKGFQERMGDHIFLIYHNLNGLVLASEPSSVMEESQKTYRLQCRIKWLVNAASRAASLWH